jgi:uncharacterized membrane protein YhaH (DUF805 family)
MLRAGRTHFLVLGVVPLLNAAALLLYGLYLATSGAGGSEKAVPLLLVLAGAGVLALGVAVVKRGRDLGWAAATSLAGLLLGALLGPMVLLFLTYVAFAKGQPGDNAFGPPAAAPSFPAWFWSFFALVVPWFAAVTAARLM